MMKTGADGKMPMPAANEKVLGGHAVLAVGYDDTAKSLIVRNSWGEKFGDKGYFYMPYEFVTEENTADFWTAE
jgi:C1A family cysteine protease